MSTKRLDWPLNSYQRAVPGPADSGVIEPINLLTPPAFYPTFTGQAEVNNPSSDRPQAYDCTGARSLTVQLDSYGVTGAGAFQILVSQNGVNYAPLFITLAGTTTQTSTIPIPTGGTNTPGGAIATIVAVDAPWFNWVRVAITSPVTGVGAGGTLTIGHRS